MNRMIIIRGGGDLATGIAYRLHRSGFSVVITEIPQPTVIRRSVSFAQAVFAGEATVEGITGRLSNYQEVEGLLANRIIPVLIDPDGDSLGTLKPDGVVDAVIAKVVGWHERVRAVIETSHRMVLGQVGRHRRKIGVGAVEVAMSEVCDAIPFGN